MLKAIDRQCPKAWSTTISSFEIKQLFRWLDNTSNTNTPIANYGLFTPILSRLELCTTVDVLLRYTQIGRESCGPILLQRIKKNRQGTALKDALSNLSSVSTKSSRTTLCS